MTETYAERLQDITELVEQLNTETTQTTSRDNEHADAHNESYDDFWGQDEDLDGGSDPSILNRDWKLRHDQFHTMGYRDGITAGKEASAQEGFNAGFKESVHAGYNWGLGRGISSTLASLSDQLKEKLTGTAENRARLQSLYESVQAISTSDALKIYYDSIQQAVSSQSRDHKELNCHAMIVNREYLGCNQLESLVKELKLCINEAPDIKVDFELGQEKVG